MAEVALLTPVKITAFVARDFDYGQLVERFSRPHGPEISLYTSLTKAAVLLLAAQWPQGIALEALHQQAVKL